MVPKENVVPIATATVALRRVYADISGQVDADLELWTAALGISKKKMLEKLINEGVAKWRNGLKKSKK